MKILRRYGWRRDTKEARLKLGPPYRAISPAASFPSAFDLGATPNPAFGLLDQGSLGSCTGFGCKRAAWYGMLAAGAAATPPTPIPEPSALFQYQNELQLDGDFGQDNGSTISQGINALKQFGIAPETDWPYNPANLAVKAPQQAYDDALKFKALQAENILNDENLAENIMDCLFNQRLPIVFGADLFQQFESEQCEQGGIVAMPAPGESPIGGHCQVMRGWKPSPNGRLLIQINNSWGQWGDNGCDWMPIEYLAAYASDLWAIPQME